MAHLIQCPTCNGNVSSSAEKCPHCGQQLRRSFTTSMRFGFGICAVIVLIGGCRATYQAEVEKQIQEMQGK
jgi:hypothetical protein